MADLEVRHNEKFHRFEAGEPSNLAKLNYHPAATAVEMVATRRLSHSGNQSMPMGTSMVSQG